MRTLFPRLSRALALAPLLGALAAPAGAETIEEIYRLARENDALLKAQAAQAAAGKETANIYRAALLPQGSFEGSRAESDSNMRGSRCAFAGKTRCDGVENDTDKDAFTVSQQLLNVEAWYDFQKGKKLSEQAGAQYRADELELLVRVTEAYVNVLAAIDTYQTALAEEEAIARQLEQTQQRFEVGLIAITDVQESQASYDRARVNTLNALGRIGIAFEAVEVLTGQPMEKIASVAEDLPIRMPEPASMAEWEKLALENNPDLAVSTLAVDAARQNARARKAAHLPTVYGALQHNDTDSTTHYQSTRVLDDQDGNVVSLNLHMPLFAGGGISAQRRQAYQQQMASEENHTYLLRNTVQQARSYHLAVVTDIERVAAQQQAILSAQSALDATQAGYEVGTRNIVDVLDAQQRLYNARLAHALSRYRYIIDMLRLLQTAGTLSEDNLMKLNAWLKPEKSYFRADYALVESSSPTLPATTAPAPVAPVTAPAATPQ